MTSCVPKAAMKTSIESSRVRLAIFIWPCSGSSSLTSRGYTCHAVPIRESADREHLDPAVDLRRRDVCASLVTSAKRVGASDGPVRRPHRDGSPRLLGDSIGGGGVS